MVRAVAQAVSLFMAAMAAQVGPPVNVPAAVVAKVQPVVPAVPLSLFSKRDAQQARNVVKPCVHLADRPVVRVLDIP